MVYGVKEILIDTLVIIAEDIGIKSAYPIAQMLAQHLTESELTNLTSRLGACNNEDIALPFFNAGRKSNFPIRFDGTERARRREARRRESQKEIFFPLIQPAIEAHRERLATQELRDITCHYHCSQGDPRDEQSHDIRMIMGAGGETYKRIPWDAETGQAAFLALCPLSITITLENRVGQADSQLCLVEHNVDPAPLLATTPGEDSDDIVPIIRTLSETDAWYDQGPRKRKIMNTQAWVRSQAFPTTFEGVTIDTHVTSLGGPMPKDMFPVYNNPQAAPQNGDPSNSQGSTRVKLDKAKGKRPIFELAEDPSPPESLMIQRE